MCSLVLGKASDHPEMRPFVQLPMHIDSPLSSNIQLADWVAACVTRAIENQLIRDSPYEWVARTPMLKPLRGAFTHESKVHLYLKSTIDLNHSEIFNRTRRVHPTPEGQLLNTSIDPVALRRIRAAAEKGTDD